MTVESWIKPDEAPEMAAFATAMIDAALVGSGLARDAYWAAVRKGYNTPYNDPQPRTATVSVVEPAVTIAVSEPALPVAAMAAANAAEIHAV